MRRLVAIIVAVVLFCAGGACGWLMRGDGVCGIVWASENLRDAELLAHKIG